MGYLDGRGLTYLWGKINAALGTKQDAASAVTMEQVNEAIQAAISAGSGGTGGGAEDIYSTQERVVGRWIDNKPLYRRTIERSGIYLTGKSVEFLLNLQDCRIHNWYGYVDDGYDQYPLNFNVSDINLEFQVGTERYLLTYLSDCGQSLILQSGYNIAMSNVSAVVTVEYTKTADQPAGAAVGEAT